MTVSRTLKEIDRESKILYDELMEYLGEEYGEYTTLAIMIATGSIALKMWKDLVLNASNPTEKEIAEEVMNRFIKYVLKLRNKLENQRLR
jgi:hypothetical protein